MSRDLFSVDAREQPEQGGDRARHPHPSHFAGTARQNERPPVDPETRQVGERRPARERKPEALDSPRAHYLGNHTYFVRDSELQTLAEVGTFRAIAGTDLAQFSYGGDTKRMDREIRRLRQQALLTEREVPDGLEKTIRLVALTRRGARLLRNSGRVPEEQAIYPGFAKPRDAKHDADLYRLYQAEVARIENSGGRAARVVLDYELMRNLNRDLAALPPGEQTSEEREEIAERHGLSVVNGKIPVPDLRIEYDTAEMERTHLDLELVTRNYRPRALVEKAQAGFSLYARREDASRLRRVLDEREITAEILSL